MSKYNFEVPTSGYSRGYTVYSVEADTEEEGLALIKEGEGSKVAYICTRDDMDSEWDEAEIV